MPFNSKLKELRLQNDLTQAQLARKLDMVTRTYIYYETGKRNPSAELLTRIAEFFSVSISFLVDEQNENIAQEKDVKVKKLEVKQLVKEINSLFARNELSEIEKYALLKELHEVCEKSKNINIST